MQKTPLCASRKDDAETGSDGGDRSVEREDTTSTPLLCYLPFKYRCTVRFHELKPLNQRHRPDTLHPRDCQLFTKK